MLRFDTKFDSGSWQALWWIDAPFMNDGFEVVFL